MKFLANVDLVKNQLINAVIDVRGSAPSTPASGQIYYDTVSKSIKVYTGAAWLDLGDQIPLSTITADKAFVGTGNGTGQYVPALTNQGVSGGFLRMGVSGTPGTGNLATFRADGLIGETTLGSLGAGTVSSVDISGSNGIVVGGTHPVTGSGTIGLTLTAVPNAALANNSVTIGQTVVSLGGTATSIANIGNISSTGTFFGNLSGSVSGAASVSATSVTATNITGTLTGTSTGLAGSPSITVTTVTATTVNSPTISATNINVASNIGASGAITATGAVSGSTVNGIVGLSSTNPLINGVAGSGTSTSVSRQDHVHPTDTSLIPKSTATAVNQVIIGTGASTVSQLTIGANTAAANVGGGLAAVTIVTDLTSAAVSAHDSLPTALAAKNYVNSYVIANNALRYKGTIAGSGALPAASAGDMYMVNSAASAIATTGPTVAVGDMVICVTANAGGNWATAGTNFDIINTNIDDTKLPRRFSTSSASAAALAAITYAHGLGTAPGKATADLSVSVYANTGNSLAITAGEQVFPDIKVDTTNITITMGVASSVGDFTIVANG